MIRSDSELFAKINLKFSGYEKDFPTSELETFLSEINSTIQYYRAYVFIPLKDVEDVGYCRLPKLKGFSNLEQELFANGVISDLVSDIGNGIHFLDEDKLENDLYIELYLGDFFRQSKKQRNQILYEIKYQKNFDRIFKEHGLYNLEEELEGLDTKQEKAEAINKYIFEFELNPEARQYLPANNLIAKNMLAKLMFEPSSSYDLEREDGDNLKKPDDRMDIFHKYGFRLFDHLMKKHLSSSKNGFQSDIAFFYRMMKEREKNPFIHATQNTFNHFLSNEYPDLESMGKFKVWDDINNEKRRQAYSAAKEAIGLK